MLSCILPRRYAGLVGLSLSHSNGVVSAAIAGPNFQTRGNFQCAQPTRASTLTKSLCQAWLRNRLTLSLSAEMDLRRRRRPTATRGPRRQPHCHPLGDDQLAHFFHVACMAIDFWPGLPSQPAKIAIDSRFLTTAWGMFYVRPALGDGGLARTSSQVSAGSKPVVKSNYHELHHGCDP